MLHSGGGEDDLVLHLSTHKLTATTIESHAVSDALTAAGPAESTHTGREPSSRLKLWSSLPATPPLAQKAPRGGGVAAHACEHTHRESQGHTPSKEAKLGSCVKHGHNRPAAVPIIPGPQRAMIKIFCPRSEDRDLINHQPPSGSANQSGLRTRPAKFSDRSCARPSLASYRSPSEGACNFSGPGPEEEFTSRGVWASQVRL